MSLADLLVRYPLKIPNIGDLANKFNAQLKARTAKTVNFLNTLPNKAFYLFFIGPRESKNASAKNSILQKTAQYLAHAEHSEQNLVFHLDAGILLLTHDFDFVLGCFLQVKELQKERGEKASGEVCMGAELCITGNDAFSSHFNSCLLRVITIAYLNTDDSLLISRGIFEVRKKSLTANKKIRLQKYREFRFAEEKAPTAIYQLDTRHKKMLFPSTVRYRGKTLSRLALALVIGAAVFLFPFLRVKVFQPVRVILRGKLPAKVYIDYKDDAPITGIWDPVYQGYTVNDEVLPGKHILFYDENTDKRHFQPILIRDGDNPILLQWQETKLPYTYLWIDYKDKSKWDSGQTSKTTYVIYDRETFEPLVINAVIELKVKVQPRKNGLLRFLFNWKVTENDHVRSQGGRIIDRDPGVKKVYKENTVLMSKNDYTFYHYSIRIDERFFRFYVNSSFIEYFSRITAE